MCNENYIVTPELLLHAMGRELDRIYHLGLLLGLADSGEDRVLLQGIHNDQWNLVTALMALYQNLTGQEPPALQSGISTISSYQEGLGGTIPVLLEDSTFYRCIYLGCDNPMRSLFLDAMEDKNRHAALLNYLYLRQIERCCCAVEEVPTCQGLAHAVQAGESLWLIARRYGLTVEDILAANTQLDGAGSIYVGQILCIPCGGTLYTVQPGDSLWLIAQNHGVTVEDLLSSNPTIADPAAINVGQVICVPPASAVPGPEPAPEIPVPANERESLTYLYGATADGYLEQLDITGDSITTVCPDFFEIDEAGGLLLASPDKLNQAFLEELHRRGYKVTPFLSNHWSRELGNSALDNRDRLTTQLASVIAQYNLDGVNFDIENVTEAYRWEYVELCRLMREKLPEGKTVSVAVAANPNGWTAGWHGSYDYAGLAVYCDYLVIMAYDESYQGGPEGPVSSIGFFENSIRYALDQGVPKEKIIAAIPFFGRYWKVGEAAGGIGLADRDVEYLIDHFTATVGYNDAAQSSYADVAIPEGASAPIWGGRTLGPGRYHIWYDNLRATKAKLDAIHRYDLLGAGSWALGQEDPSVWEIYSAALNG